MAQTLNDINLQKEKIVLPLHELVTQLRRNGFTIRPDDYIEMLKVVEKFGIENLEDLAPRFCPLIATSPDEQDRFYKVFEDFKAQPAPETLLPIHIWWNQIKEHYKKYKWYWLMGIGLIPLAILIYSISRPTKPSLNTSFTISKLSAGDTAYRVGDTISLDASTPVQGKASVGDVKYFWNTGNGFVADSPSIKTVLQQEGDFRAQLKLRSSAFTVKDSIYSTVFHVCPQVKIPQLTYETQYTIGQGLELNAGPFQKENNFQQVYWKVNGRKYDMPVNTDAILRLSFDSADIYQVALVGLYNNTNDESAPCNFIFPLNDIIVNTDKGYSLNTNYTGQDITSLSKNEIKPWVIWLLLLPAIVTALLNLVRLLRKHKKKETKTDDKMAFAGKKPPFETPFENKDFNQVQIEIGFREVFRSFRQKAEDELIAFNVPKSIYSTIRTGGIPELVFSNKLRYNDYLVLIDATLAKSMQVHLFDYLVRLLNEEAISVERYYYTGNFEKIFNETTPEGISFRRMSERYKHYTLIIMGNGHQLVYTHYPVLEKNLSNTLHEWEHKAILTPVSYKDWGKKERLIAEQFVLLPADISGQLKLIEAIRERQLNQEKYLSSIKGCYKTTGYDFEDVDDLKTYLGDEVLFQWLCATAVFHKLRWEILVEMGKEICAAYNEPEKMNFTSLLKLCRISWMAEGVFPAETRLELLKKLEPRNEVLARETLLRMMQYADTYFGSGYVFDEEKEIQKVTSRFLLYANNPEQFSDYKEESAKFKNLWETDHLWDMPQKVYLDNNTTEHWPSLLHHGNKNIGVQEYFNLEKHKATAANRKAFWTRGLATASFLVLLALLHLLRNNLPADSFLIRSSAAASTVYTIAVNNRISCEEATPIQSINGMLRTPDGAQIPLSFEPGTLSNDTQQYYFASLNLPVVHSNSNGLLELTWNEGNNNKTFTPIQLNNDKMQLSISACAVSGRYNVTVYYNDSTGRSDALRYVTLLTDAGYHVDSILYDRFSDSSHIDYYSRIDKAIADTMASLLSVYDQRFGTTGYTTVLNANTGNYTKQFDVMINLAKGNDAVPVSLPASLNEIWRGATNNRLMSIDVNRQIIYYSTGDKKTYGTYRVEEVWRQSNNVYQLITMADKQYAVFLLRNIQPTSFELSACPGRYNTKEEARAVNESSCDPFNRMNYYFETDPAKIYFSYRSSNLPSNQQNKLNRYIRTRINNANNANISIILSSNRFYSSILRMTPTIYDDLDKAGLNREEYTVGRYNSFPGTPFDRDYLQLQVTQTTQPKQQTVPNEPAQNIDKPAQNARETLLMTIPLDEKYYPNQQVRQNWMRDLSTIMKYLQGYSNVRLRFVAYYDSYGSSKEAQDKNNSLRNFLQQQFGNVATSRQIRYDTGEASNNQAQQNPNISTSDKVYQVDVYGTGFPPNLLRGESGN